MEETYKRAVSVFNEVRDIPYHIPLFRGEKDDCCEGKNSRLAEELVKLGYKVRPRIGLIRWSDLDIPNEIIKKGINESSHYFLEVIPPGKKEWVTVDATWNKELRKAGFPISEWNGVSASQIAVKCYELIDKEKNEEYLESIDYEKDLKENFNLYKAFNEYCDSFLNKEVKNG